MPLIGETGCLREVCGEVHVEWEIPDFLLLSEEDDSSYESPVFGFSDSCWCLNIYPMNETTNQTSRWMSLCLERKDSGPPKTVTFSLGIKKPQGNEEKLSQYTHKIPEKSGWGSTQFLLRTDLLNRKSQLTPSNVLTVTCDLKSDSPHSAEVSLFNRLWNVSRNLKKILDDETRTDFTIKLKGREMCAHRMILQSRCEYFEGMFGHDFQENATGEANIDDIEEDVFECVLRYIYSGEAEEMSNKNVRKVYVAADKFLLKQLKKLCIVYIKENLGRDLVCDAVAIADQYKEIELRECVMEYFIQNAPEVFSCDEWKEFKQENPVLSSELLENIIEERLKLGKTME